MIAVRTGINGDLLEIQAECMTHLALHPMVLSAGVLSTDSWSITYIRTGQALIIGSKCTHKAAVEAMEALDPLFADLPEDRDDPAYQDWKDKNGLTLVQWIKKLK